MEQSPLSWYGSKLHLAPRIYRFFPKHTTYVEVFGGGGAMLFYKRPSPIEVYNDLNGDLVSFFRVLQDKEKFTDLMHRLTYTLYSRQEYDEALERVQHETDDVERARLFFILSKQAPLQRFAHHYWGFVIRDSARFAPQNVQKWVKTLLALEDFHSRLVSVQIEHDDFANVIKRYDSSETLFFIDPPLVDDVKGDLRCARPSRPYGKYNTISTADAEKLVDMLLHIVGTAVTTVKAHPIYDALLKRYQREIIPDTQPLHIFHTYTNLLSVQGTVTSR